MGARGGLDPDSERLLRDLAPRVLGALMRRVRDFTAAEDAVQEALLAALAAWPERGMPKNPGAWLYRVACRSLADAQRSASARRNREEAVSAAASGESSPIGLPDELDPGGEDDTLLLLFTCCHPALTDGSAIALTLRAVGGLTTAEIARAFLVPEATMAQRISRAKRTIEESGVPFELPGPAEREGRLSAVMHVLYLIFNEGYTGTSGPDLVRVELSGEAIRLARLLHRMRPGHPEVAGLLALMLLTDARRDARAGPAGELVPLDEQDRSRWDRAMIDEGTALVAEAVTRGAIGSYEVQAAIASLHDEARTPEATDWAQILALYGVLRRIADSPVVAMNEAIAAAMVHGPEHGLRLLDGLTADPRLAGGHRLAAARAHLHERAGDRAAAIRLFIAAASAATSVPERDYLLAKAARLRSIT